MDLIGMLDSPYVRRVAVALQQLDLPFTHQSISVFRGIDQFRQINPVVKAPTLVCDDGTVLMDSTLILQYAEGLAGRRLQPGDARSLRLTGLALAACEKSVQIVYEHNVRPPEKWHQPWLTRVTEQMTTAYRLLDTELAGRPPQLDDAGITAAVVWFFSQQMHPELLPAAAHPNLSALSAWAEQQPALRAAAHGEGVYPTAG
ncbi:glutathione S-transferase [uncultured Aquincola sp.]|uniref:glutathione S-transferase n=1 Tax=uncultured Aquincola sp. TaxID=886556 RepID=UPI0032B2E7EE